MLGPLRRLKGSLRNRMNFWLARRQPETSRETLSQHNLYIMPSRQFLGFLTVTLMIWLAGTNYENNLVCYSVQNIDLYTNPVGGSDCDYAGDV